MSAAPVHHPELAIECALGRPSGFRLDVELRSKSGVVGVFGPSGAGKSTLLGALAGLLPAERVRIKAGGETIVDAARGGRAVPPHRRRVGLVFQDHRLFPHRSIEQNLRYGTCHGSGRHGNAVAVPEFGDVVELLRLGALLARRPADCSGGERQRAALGRALLAGPRVLCLDEPLASLDRGLKREILPYLAAVRDAFAVPILHVSHDLEEILALTNEVLLIEGGRSVAHGDIAELAMRPELLGLLHDCGLRFALTGVAAESVHDGPVWIDLGGGARIAAAVMLGRRPRAGDAADVLLAPEEVILAVPPLEGLFSLTNRLDGVVTRLTGTTNRHLVEIDCGVGRPVLAEVTGATVERLGIAPGKALVAMFKAQATRVRAR